MAETTETPQLEYSYLSANCGLKVSALGLGTMTFGGTHVRIKDIKFSPSRIFKLKY